LIRSLFENKVEGVLDLFEKYSFKEPISTVKNNLVKSMQRIIVILTTQKHIVDISKLDDTQLKK